VTEGVEGSLPEPCLGLSAAGNGLAELAELLPDAADQVVRFQEADQGAVVVDVDVQVEHQSEPRGEQAHQPLIDRGVYVDDERRPVHAQQCWADAERDTSAWLGNTLQRHAHDATYAITHDVLQAADRGHPELLEDWRKLTTSDHFYYMCTKYRSDGDVHEYFSPYRSPHDSFVVFMNALDDLTERVQEVLHPEKKSPRSKRG